jgi:hypothetical protein
MEALVLCFLEPGCGGAKSGFVAVMGQLALSSARNEQYFLDLFKILK